MTHAVYGLTDGLEILIDELVEDDELRRSFLRDPEETLATASEWGLPLTESELAGLRGGSISLWERIADEIEVRLAA